MDVNECLSQLGKTKEEVAANLLKLGCKGTRGSIFCCPVANYLKDKGFKYPTVSASLVCFDDDSADGGRSRMVSSCPVQEFIQAFDHGSFDELSISTVVC